MILTLIAVISILMFFAFHMSWYREEKDRSISKVSVFVEGVFVPAIRDIFGGSPGAPASWVLSKVKEGWNRADCVHEVTGTRQESPNSKVVLGADGMPLYGIASTTSFWDSDQTACGKKPNGTIDTWEGKRKNYRDHGPLAAMNHRWYKVHYTNDPPHNTVSSGFWSKGGQSSSGFCNSHCYEIIAVKSGYGDNKIPKKPIVVKIGDECTDCGWCDATEFTPSTHTSGINRGSKGNWPINVPTHVHFDIMAASLTPDHEWYQYSLNKKGAPTNFLVRFRRVKCV